MYRLKIVHDEDPFNPRTDNDNADVMFCKHGRYTLGDKDAEDPMIEVAYVDLDGYQLGDSDSPTGPVFEDVLAMLDAYADELGDDIVDATDDTSAIDDETIAAMRADRARAEAGCAFLRNLKWRSEYRLRPGIAICRPLYLYDHGGITISAGAFGCPWDSGQVGWQYVTDKALAEEWAGDEAKAISYMDATLSEYDSYLRGEVYGFIVERGTPTIVTTKYPDGTSTVTEDVEWEQTDSCWGFIGDFKESGIRDYLPTEAEPMFDAMSWTDIDEWQYSADCSHG